MDRPTLAAEYFCSGYNCAQSVAMAFCDVTGMDPKCAAQLASGYGGGFGRIREVCGAISGAVLVTNYLYGYNTPDPERQLALYAIVQHIMHRFQEGVGSYICRDILGNPPSDPAPTPRTAEYYAKRPCARMVMLAAEILDEYISEHPIH